jgi:thioredoxin-like negative regulator of GroEL
VSDDDDSDYDSDFDDDNGDDDPTLEAFRARRLAELKNAQAQLMEHKAKGHGEVRTISQDEFLPECTSSKYVAAHFFHNDFERCKIMDHHLQIIAKLHLKCKFIRMDADKAPFFVNKLQIQTLPTLIIFKDGKTIDQLIGFDGMSESKNPDEFPTSQLGRWIEQTGAIEYDGPESEDEEFRPNGRTGMMQSRLAAYDEDI